MGNGGATSTGANVGGGTNAGGNGGAQATGGGGASSSSSSSSSGTGGSAQVCGDGVREPPEKCDGSDVGNHDCTDYGFKNPAGLGCTSDCAHLDPSGCMAACGNGQLEPGEDCDGNDLDGHDCTEYGFVSAGGLACTGCMLDPTGCHPTCGNMVIEPGETCDDGNMMSGDGCSSTCQTETDDGKSCANAIPIDLDFGSAMASGTTTGGGAHTSSTCGSAGADIVYAVTVENDGFLTANLPRSGTAFDSVLYASTACSDSSVINALTCNDSKATSGNTPLLGGEVISFPVQQGQTYFVFVDAHDAAAGGAYQINFDLSTGADCTDPVPIPLAPGSPMTLLGNNLGTGNNTQGSCGGGPGNEVVYAITTPVTAGLKIATQNVDYNTVLYARSTCNSGASELACSNLAGNGGNENITIPMATASTSISLYVDGSQIPTGPQNGDYQLVLTPP